MVIKLSKFYEEFLFGEKSTNKQAFIRNMQEGMFIYSGA